MMRLVEIFLFL